MRYPWRCNAGSRQEEVNSFVFIHARNKFPISFLLSLIGISILCYALTNRCSTVSNKDGNLADSELDIYLVEEVFDSDNFYYIPKRKIVSKIIPELILNISKYELANSDGHAGDGYAVQIISIKRGEESGSLWRTANSGEFILEDKIVKHSENKLLKFTLVDSGKVSKFYRYADFHNELNSIISYDK